MNKIIAIATVMMATASAFAGVKAVVRGDYVNTPKFDSRNANNVDGSSFFRGSVANLALDAKVGSATVDGQINFDKVGATVSSEDLVDHLVISKELGNGITAHVGKLSTLNGGYEQDMAAAGQVYLATLAGGGIAGYDPTSIGQLAWLTATAPVAYAGNSRGVDFTYMMGDHKFDFMVTNSTNHGAGNYKRNNIGVYYAGSFSDKTITPRFGYMSGGQDTAATGVEEVYAHLGSGFKFSQVGLLVEYLMNTSKTGSAKTNGVTSLYALVDYKMDSWKPFLKIESSEYKSLDDSSSTSSFKRTAYNLGVELTPNAADAFSYHASYAVASDKYGSTTTQNKDTVSWTQLMVGVTYAADLLK